MINIVKTYFSTKRLTIDFFVRGREGGKESPRTCKNIVCSTCNCRILKTKV